MNKRPIVVIKLLLSCACIFVPLSVACIDGDSDSPNDLDATETPTRPSVMATATPTASVEMEIISAYLKYWDAYTNAVLNLDVSAVDGMARGEELQAIRDEVDELKAKGLAVRTVVTHNPVVIQVTGDTAVLQDEMVNNSFYVDPKTKDPPVASGSGEVLRDTFYLQKVNGVWTVTRSVRER
jgi:hypothetical protein